MSTKVKVTNDIANAIKWFKEMQKDKFNITDIDELLNLATDWWLRGEFHEFADLHVVHELKFIEFCNALYYGYEVELTPEEIIKEKYEELLDYEPIDRACKDSFRFVLDTLSIKIEGVNE